ncbi:neural Wiskott-Aldrich syndrome protein-like [Schistocerca americana]|uniref:neural Wiskott-Aldrich syndrome protein-like n=1 Tax=Schistocerca americana TaxID=7009 RepID=UPI001F4F5F69|nr:neural Wiskott-Aldrich syndrome protein-like [Schistocerca americana]
MRVDCGKQDHKVEVCRSSSSMLGDHTFIDASDSLEDDSVPPLQISFVQIGGFTDSATSAYDPTDGPPRLGTPPRSSRLPSSKSPLPVRLPAWDGRLWPPTRPYLRPLLAPPCPSVLLVPMDAEAAVTPPPPSPMEVVAPPAHPSIPSGGARP